MDLLSPKPAQQVDAHNIYRCMHDVKPLMWSEAVYQDALRTFRDQSTPSHSDSFSLLAPAGPAGENLYKSFQRTADPAHESMRMQSLIENF